MACVLILLTWACSDQQPKPRCACHQDRLKVRQALLSPLPPQPPCGPELWVKGTLAAVEMGTCSQEGSLGQPAPE